MIYGVDRCRFPGSFRGMPKRNDMKTKLAGVGMATGDEWKDIEFAGDPAMGDDFQDEEYSEESEEEWEMSDEEIDEAVSTFAGIVDELDGDPDDDELGVLGGDDDLLGGVDDEDFDLLGGDEVLVDTEDEDFDLLEDDEDLEDSEDWEDLDGEPVLEDFGDLDEF